MDSYYNGAWRMDWGLGNPNKTAVLIACLMITVWSLALIYKGGFWPALVVFAALAWCLVETYSRGGMVALLAGVAVLLFSIPRPWPKARWIGVAALLGVLAAFVFYAKAQARYGHGLFDDDQSIDNRLIIWKQVPAMMAAAPWGCGLGNAGDFYTQWFQPVGCSQNYLNLINSHFNVMVEGGWLASVAYLIGWFAVFLLCRPLSEARLKAIPLAIWVTFGAGATFSHIEDLGWLWMLPLGALGYVILERFNLHQWPRFRSFLAGGLLSFGIVGLLVLIGIATAPILVHFDRGAVTIGKGPVTTIVLVDRKVMGSLYGHTFRKFVAANPAALSGGSFIFIETPRDLSSAPMANLVISGRFAPGSEIVSKFGQGKQVILVNPSGFPDDAGLSHDAIQKTIVYFGEYSQAPSRSSWANYPGIRIIQIDGASDFVPSWPEAIWSSPKI